MMTGAAGMAVGGGGGQGDLYSRLGRVEEAISSHKENMRDIWTAVNELKRVAQTFSHTGARIADKLDALEAFMDSAERRMKASEDAQTERKGVAKIVGPLATATGGGVIAIAVQWFTHWIWPPPGH